jgi:hypothetical protein
MARNDYTYFWIPPSGGKSELKIPMAPQDPNDDTVRSPEWMVQIDDLVASNVDGFEKFGELLGWDGESSRYTSGDLASKEIFSSATLKHSDVTLVMPYGSYGPELETRMNKGTPLGTVMLVRLGNINAAKVIQQSIEFSFCRIQSYRQMRNEIVLRIRVSMKKHICFSFDENGNAQGQTVSTVDYRKGAIT